jgi:hypothetical protein
VLFLHVSVFAQKLFFCFSIPWEELMLVPSGAAYTKKKGMETSGNKFSKSHAKLPAFMDTDADHYPM